MPNPIAFFFSLGDKVTKGDIKRKADWDYYLLWIMFLAFFSVLVSNFNSFLQTVNTDFMLSLKYLGWSGVMAAIMWFQYYGLKAAYEMRKAIKSQVIEKKEEKEVSIDEMLKDFK